MNMAQLRGIKDSYAISWYYIERSSSKEVQDIAISVFFWNCKMAPITHTPSRKTESSLTSPIFRVKWRMFSKIKSGRVIKQEKVSLLDLQHSPSHNLLSMFSHTKLVRKRSNGTCFNFWCGLWKCRLCQCLQWYDISYCLLCLFMRTALNLYHFLFWNDYRLIVSLKNHTKSPLHLFSDSPMLHIDISHLHCPC